VTLALMSGIAPSVWEAEGDRAIATAFELLAEKGNGAGDDDDMVMSG
jgi:hypothetical protein